MKQFFVSVVVTLLFLLNAGLSNASEESFTLSRGETLFALCAKIRPNMTKDACSKEILFANKDRLNASWNTVSEVELSFGKKLWAGYAYNLPNEFISKATDTPSPSVPAKEGDLVVQEKPISQKEIIKESGEKKEGGNSVVKTPETKNDLSSVVNQEKKTEGAIISIEVTKLEENLKKKDAILFQIKEENFRLQREFDRVKQSEEALKVSLKENTTRLEKLNSSSGTLLLVSLVTSLLLLLGGIGFFFSRRNLKKNGFTRKKRIDSFYQIPNEELEEDSLEEETLQKENEELRRKITSLEEENEILFEKKVYLSIGGETHAFEVKRFIRDKWGGIVPMIAVDGGVLYKAQGKKVPKQWEERLKNLKMAA
ncbi:MAG: hypothetical protein IPN70_03430 [Candidatus Moraniibacteriota bacterium]|nr:MAG: hypothetical protein IPN70_03430 [Candidatus Moranbacteria bacterium]